MYNEGISVAGDLLDTAVEHKIVNKAGASYTYGEERLAVGREKAKVYLKEHPKTLKELKEKIWEAVNAGEAPEEEKGVAGEKDAWWHPSRASG